LVITTVLLVALWAAAWFTFRLGYAWATPLIAIPAAGFLMRLFLIQHDCGHGCPYRKLDPDVVMVQPTKHRLSFDTPVTLNGPSIGRIFP
jgi:hypothetical protein